MQIEAGLGHGYQDQAGTSSLRLSEQQRRILQMIIDGRTTRQIGFSLGIGESTVDYYRRHIRDAIPGDDLDDKVKMVSIIARAVREGVVTVADVPNELHITPQETEVISLLRAGRKNEDIVNDLDIALKTVEAHMHHVFAKLGASNYLQAVAKLVAYEEAHEKVGTADHP